MTDINFESKTAGNTVSSSVQTCNNYFVLHRKPWNFCCICNDRHHAGYLHIFWSPVGFRSECFACLDDVKYSEEKNDLIAKLNKSNFAVTTSLWSIRDTDNEHWASIQRVKNTTSPFNLPPLWTHAKCIKDWERCQQTRSDFWSFQIPNVIVFKLFNEVQWASDFLACI